MGSTGSKLQGTSDYERGKNKCYSCDHNNAEVVGSNPVQCCKNRYEEHATFEPSLSQLPLAITLGICPTWCPFGVVQRRLEEEGGRRRTRHRCEKGLTKETGEEGDREEMRGRQRKDLGEREGRKGIEVHSERKSEGRTGKKKRYSPGW